MCEHASTSSRVVRSICKSSAEAVAFESNCAPIFGIILVGWLKIGSLCLFAALGTQFTRPPCTILVGSITSRHWFLLRLLWHALPTMSPSDMRILAPTSHEIQDHADWGQKPIKKGPNGPNLHRAHVFLHGLGQQAWGHFVLNIWIFPKFITIRVPILGFLLFSTGPY